MSSTHFTYGGVLSKSWRKVLEHLWFLGLVTLGMFMINIMAGSVPVLGSIVQLMAAIAVMSVSLKIADGHTPAFKDLVKPFETYKIFWHYFLATLVYVGVLFTGFLVLIAPVAVLAGLGKIGWYPLLAGGALFFLFVFIVAVRFGLYAYAVVDNETCKPLEAIRTSVRITKGKFWKIFGFMAILFLLNLLGAILFLVGLFVTVPLTFISMASLYRELHR